MNCCLPCTRCRTMAQAVQPSPARHRAMAPATSSSNLALNPHNSSSSRMLSITPPTLPSSSGHSSRQPSSSSSRPNSSSRRLYNSSSRGSREVWTRSSSSRQLLQRHPHHHHQSPHLQLLSASHTLQDGMTALSITQLMGKVSREPLEVGYK